MYTHRSEGTSSLAPADAETVRVTEALAGSWANRVAVRTGHVDLRAYYDEAIPDYPPALVPFADDPRYLALQPDARARILAAAWVAYNEKTIDVEVSVVAPACDLLLRGAFAGLDTTAFKRTVAQTQVDEQFHVLMCLDGCLVARERHRIESLRIPKSLATRELDRAKSECRSPRDAELVQLAFATVAEVTINAYLDLVANDAGIQPLNREITALHRRDESSHNKLFKEFTKAMFVHLDDAERATYVRGLSSGLDAFVKMDFDAWRAILTELGVPEAEDIIHRCAVTGPAKRVVRDYSGFRALLRDIGVLEEDIAFEFGSP